MLHLLLEVLQPDAASVEVEDREERSAKATTLTQWLTKFVRKEELLKAAQEGRIAVLQPKRAVTFAADASGGKVESQEAELRGAPLTYVDSTSLANLLGSVLSHKFGEERDSRALLKDAEAKTFAVDFLTKFLVKAYAKDNKVDLTEVDFLTQDKNNLKRLGVATEDLEKAAVRKKQ